MKQLTTVQRQEVLRRIKSKKSYTDYITGILGCNVNDAKKIAKSIVSDTKEVSAVVSNLVTAEPISRVELLAMGGGYTPDTDLQHEYDGKGNLVYTFNPHTKDYCVHLKSAGKIATIKQDQLDGMISAYSTFAGDDKSQDALARHYGVTVPIIKEILGIFKITKDSLPVTPEHLLLKDNDAIVNDLKSKRMFEITQKFNKDSWEETQKDATKFQQLKANQLNPFVEALNNFSIPALPPVQMAQYDYEPDVDTEEVFMVCLSDLHFGACVHTNDVHGGQEYNIQRVIEIVDNLTDRIIQDLNNRYAKPRKAVVAIVGDILHTLTGKTQRGTNLDYDRIGAEQFRAAMTSLTRFMQRMLQMFETVNVQTVRGNHAGASEAGLYYAIQNAFINEKRISFNIVDTRVTTFKVAGGYVMLDHGDSDIIPEKARVPTGDKARDQYIRKRFEGYVSEWHDAKFKLFIQGDLHHYERKDYGGFEFIMLPAPIGVDKYTHHLNLGSVPAQKCFILNKDGIKEELTYVFR